MMPMAPARHRASALSRYSTPMPNAVEEAVRLWEAFREGTIGELTNIPPEKWDYRPGEGARSVREVALHILASGVGFTEELLAPDANFGRLRDPAAQARLMEPYATSMPLEIIELLKRKGADGAKRLRKESASLAQSTMPSFGGEQGRAAGVAFAAAHEMYHRGQLTTYARALGIVPAMTKRTQAAK